MRLVPFDSVTIAANRQRQEFDPQELMELTESIRDRGLMHAPVVREEGDLVVLVAGERRMRAIKDLWELGDELHYNATTVPEGLLPVVTLGELLPLEAEEAELDENLKRKDLTWQEHAAAVERLHKLRSAQSLAEGLPPQTVAATTKELHPKSNPENLGVVHETVRRELIVAKHLDNPEVAKAKNVDEAFKILKRQEEREQNKELALIVGATFNSDKHQIFNVDCLSWMAKPERAGTVDVILTDPPYGMDADQFGDGAGKMTAIVHNYDDSYDHWKGMMFSWAQLSFQVAKPQAHAYVFCDIDRFHELKGWMQQAGWDVFRTPLVNFKRGSGRVPRPTVGPRRQYELVLYAIKGNMPVTGIYPDVIEAEADEQMGHGAQKPVAVYQNLLQRSVRPGMVVLDCFAGSGTVLPAAHGFKCSAIALELDEGSYGLCLKRAKALKALEEPALF